jgi:hypothetical protein
MIPGPLNQHGLSEDHAPTTCLFLLESFSAHDPSMPHSFTTTRKRALDRSQRLRQVNSILLAIMAQSLSPCGTVYIAGCLSTAIISACGDVSSTSCICGTSGQGAIASLVGPCLIAACPYTEILAIGNFATSVCDEWLSTHLLTTTAGGYINATSSAVGPVSTTFSSITTSSPGDMSITSSPTTPTSLPTNTSTATASQGLSVGADVGVGIGALAIVCFIAILAFYLRRRRSREPSAEAHELQSAVHISELPDKPQRLEEIHVVDIPRHELEGFQFPFQKPQIAPVEADSQSVRAQSRGRVTGTETTAFDFESQKVLLTPGLRDQSRASSRAPASSPASIRRNNTDT